jgi:hypothetical protein
VVAFDLTLSLVRGEQDAAAGTKNPTELAHHDAKLRTSYVDQGVERHEAAEPRGREWKRPHVADQWVVATRFFSTELVVELLRLVGEWSDAFYRQVGLDTISREPVGFFGADAPSPYWQVIAREYVERFVHQSQIRRAIGAPELDGEVVAGAARVVVHALAAWLRNYDAAVGSTIGIDFGTAGSWTWQRESDHWSVVDGPHPAPTAQVTVARERTVAMLSRGVSSDEALAGITITGDDTVARGALDLIAPILGVPGG